LAAVAGPIPGTYYNPSDVAVLGFRGRFLLPGKHQRWREQAKEKNGQEKPDGKGIVARLPDCHASSIYLDQ
jgi:hypothetical protein